MLANTYSNTQQTWDNICIFGKINLWLSFGLYHLLRELPSSLATYSTTSCIFQGYLETYRKAVCNAGSPYYSTLLEEHRKNPRFLFSTEARLSESQSSFEPCVPLSLTSDFLNDKIVVIRDKVDQMLALTATSLALNTGALGTFLRPDTVHI